MHLKTLIKRRRGSLMMQVIVSVFVLSLGLVGALTLIVAAIDSNQTNLDRMTATNLAQEGLEVVRNMRDTNWLTYSSNLRECWNFWDDTDENGVLDASDDECTPSSGQNEHPWGLSDEGGVGNTDTHHFIVDFDPTSFRWVMVPENRFNDIATYANGFKLYKTTLDGSSFYTHRSIDNTETLFSRRISLYYIDAASGFDDTGTPGVDCPPAGPEKYDVNGICGGDYPSTQKAQDNRILVIARVSWKKKGHERNIVLSTILTDFLDRSEWDS